jgi:hypothetical protein
MKWSKIWVKRSGTWLPLLNKAAARQPPYARAITPRYYTVS